MNRMDRSRETILDAKKFVLDTYGKKPWLFYVGSHVMPAPHGGKHWEIHVGVDELKFDQVELGGELFEDHKGVPVRWFPAYTGCSISARPPGPKFGKAAQALDRWNEVRGPNPHESLTIRVENLQCTTGFCHGIVARYSRWSPGQPKTPLGIPIVWLKMPQEDVDTFAEREEHRMADERKLNDVIKADRMLSIQEMENDYRSAAFKVSKIPFPPMNQVDMSVPIKTELLEVKPMTLKPVKELLSNEYHMGRLKRAMAKSPYDLTDEDRDLINKASTHQLNMVCGIEDEQPEEKPMETNRTEKPYYTEGRTVYYPDGMTAEVSIMEVSNSYQVWLRFSEAYKGCNSASSMFTRGHPIRVLFADKNYVVDIVTPEMLSRMDQVEGDDHAEPTFRIQDNW